MPATLIQLAGGSEKINKYLTYLALKKNLEWVRH